MPKMTRKKKLGQFFTPKIIVDFMYDLVSLGPLDKVIDPSCGEGIFLMGALDHGCGAVTGIDIDEDTIEGCRINLRNYGDNFHLLCQDGLKDIETENCFWKGNYDLAIGNPPFNSRSYRIQDKKILRRFELAGVEESDNDNYLPLSLDNKLIKPTRLRASQAIEVLFLEHFITLCKPGGKVVIILPEGVFANTNMRNVRRYLVNNTTIKAIIGLPRDTFKSTGTKAKTAILYLHTKKPKNGHKTFLASVESLDEKSGELEKILENFRRLEAESNA